MVGVVDPRFDGEVLRVSVMFDNVGDDRHEEFGKKSCLLIKVPRRPHAASGGVEAAAFFQRPPNSLAFPPLSAAPPSAAASCFRSLTAPNKFFF